MHPTTAPLLDARYRDPTTVAPPLFLRLRDAASAGDAIPPGRLLRITERKCSIGSSENCSLRLLLPHVDPIQALIVRGPGGTAIRSFSDKTRLNGQPFVNDWLHPGDVIQLGPVELECLDVETSGSPTIVVSAPRDANRADDVMQSIEQATANIGKAQRRITRCQKSTRQLIGQLSELSRQVEEIHSYPSPAAPDQAIQLQEVLRRLTDLDDRLKRQQAEYSSERTAWVAQCEEALGLIKSRPTDDSSRPTAELNELNERLQEILQHEQRLAEKQQELKDAEVAFQLRLQAWEAECREAQAELERDRERLASDQHAWSEQQAEGLAELDRRSIELKQTAQTLANATQNRNEANAESPAIELANRELAQTVSELQEQLEQTRQASQAELERLQQTNRELETRLVEKQADLDTHDEKQKILRDELETVRSQFEEIEAQFAINVAAEHDVQAFHQKCEELTAELSQISNEKERLQEELDLIRAEQEESVRSSSRIDARLAEISADYETLQRSRADWEEQRRADEDSLNARVIELNESLAQLQRQEESLAEREAAVAELEQQRAELQTQYAAFEAEREQAWKALEQAQCERSVSSPQELDATPAPDAQLLFADDQENSEFEPAASPEQSIFAPEPTSNRPDTSDEVSNELFADEPAQPHELTPFAATVGETAEELGETADEHTADITCIMNAGERESLLSIGSEPPAGEQEIDQIPARELEQDEREEEMPETDQDESEVGDEISFSTPGESAPVSTAEILARMGHQIEVDVEDEDPAPTLMARSENSQTEVEHQDDINSYMAQLMQRVGSSTPQPHQETEQATKKPTKSPTESQPRNTDVAEPVLDEAELPLDFANFVPRAKAPEGGDNLRSLRELANSSTRTALSQHEKSRLLQIASIMAIVAIVAIMVSATVIFVAKSVFSVATLVATVAAGIGVAAIFQSLNYLAKSRFGREASYKDLSKNDIAAAISLSARKEPLPRDEESEDVPGPPGLPAMDEFIDDRDVLAESDGKAINSRLEAILHRDHQPGAAPQPTSTQPMSTQPAPPSTDQSHVPMPAINLEASAAALLERMSNQST